MKTKEKIEISFKKYELVNQWISNCDTKSSFLLGFYGVFLTIILTSKIFDKIESTFSMTLIKDCFKFNQFINFLTFISLLYFIFFSISCFYYIYKTIIARINSNVFSENELITRSNFFFLTIANNKFEDFNKSIKTENEETILEDLNSQIFINSKIATEKFNNYNKSLKNAFISFGLFLLYLFLSY